LHRRCRARGGGGLLMEFHIFAQVVIPGVPPSPNELKGLHPMEHHRRTAPFKGDAYFAAQSARNKAGWPLPIRTETPTPRYVRVWLYRARQLDQDNAVGSLKPVIDGLKKILLWDDSPNWCRLLDPIQKPLEGGQERTVVEIYLTDPRAVEPMA